MKTKSSSFSKSKIRESKFFTKQLMVRSLAIVVLPLIAYQVIVFLFFYENHWRSVSRYLAHSVKGEMTNSIFVLKTDAKVFEQLQKVFKESLETHLNFYPNRKLNWEKEQPNKYKYLAFGEPLGGDFTTLHNYKSTLKRSIENHRQFVYQVEIEEGIIEMIFSDKRLVTPTIATFLVWLIVSFVVVVIVSVYFLRLQIKPILMLARSARRFGQNKSIKYIPVVGAYEIRTAISSFNQMYRRLFELKKQQKTMLQALSHDIRAPLARLRVMTSFLKEAEERNGFQNDIEFIDLMLKQYVDYIVTEGEEDISQVNFIPQLNSLCNLYKAHLDIHITSSKKPIYIQFRKRALNRLISNLLDNSTKYAKRVDIKVVTNSNFLRFTIDDDGPGIPAGLRKKVLLPFFSLDLARTPDHSPSTGLGLALCQGIVEQHQGQIVLTASQKLGGLKVNIKLPLGNNSSNI